MNQFQQEFPPPPQPDLPHYYDGEQNYLPPPVVMNQPAQQNYSQNAVFQGEYIHRPYAPLPQLQPSMNPSQIFTDELTVGEMISCKI